jgi:flagellin-like protein
MKGITPIISIIVLLLITVSLAGAAYVFLGGVMTGFTQGVQLTGICVGGTEAFITVTNQGSNRVNLGSCNVTVGGNNPVQGPSTTCGDYIIIRTDANGAAMDGIFDAATIQGADPNKLYRTTFHDTACGTSGPATCKYAFTRAGEVAPVEVTVSCSG